jgi:hypothetical protein
MVAMKNGFELGNLMMMMRMNAQIIVSVRTIASLETITIGSVTESAIKASVVKFRVTMKLVILIPTLLVIVNVTTPVIALYSTGVTAPVKVVEMEGRMVRPPTTPSGCAIRGSWKHTSN